MPSRADLGTTSNGQLTLGEALRKARDRRRLSLRDLADEIGVSFNTLSRIERGRVPKLENYNRVVKWLGSPDPTDWASPILHEEAEIRRIVRDEIAKVLCQVGSGLEEEE